MIKTSRDVSQTVEKCALSAWQCFPRTIPESVSRSGWLPNLTSFYSASALLAMQSAVLAIEGFCLSVRPSVRLSVTFRYCVQMNEDTIVRFLPRCMECRRGLAMGILSVCMSVCLSVCLYVRQTRGLRQNGRKLYLDFYIIRKNIYPSFLRRRMVGGGRPLLPKILGQPARVWAKSPIFNR